MGGVRCIFRAYWAVCGQRNTMVAYQILFLRRYRFVVLSSQGGLYITAVVYKSMGSCALGHAWELMSNTFRDMCRKWLVSTLIPCRCRLSWAQFKPFRFHGQARCCLEHLHDGKLHRTEYKRQCLAVQVLFQEASGSSFCFFHIPNLATAGRLSVVRSWILCTPSTLRTTGD